MEVSRDNLPRSMRFALSSVPAVQAECQLARFDSTNGVDFAPGGADQIRIRVKANGFLNGAKHYLQFKVTTATAESNIDGDAGSFFDRVTIEANGSQVEQIDRYALYNGIRRNYNADTREIYKKSVESGGGQLQCAMESTGDAADDGKVSNVALSNLGLNITAGHSKVFCIQLQSGLLMNTHSKALPDGLSELEFVLRLKSNTGALVAHAGAPTFTIHNPRIYAPVYRIQNGDVMSSYGQLASSGISWTGDTVKTYVNSIPNNAGPQSLQLNDRSMSLKALVTALRDDTADATQTSYSNTGFFLGNGVGACASFYYRISGNNYPQSQIDIVHATNGLNYGRAYEEAIKSLAKHGEPYANAQVDLTQFSATSVTMTTVAGGNDTKAITAAKGLLCVDLRKFDDNELRMVGINTASNASPSTLEVDVGTTPMGTALDATTFAIVEAVWTMDNTGALRVAM